MLVELFLTVLAAGLLASLVMPRLFTRSAGSGPRPSKTVADLRILAESIERFRNDVGRYPSDEEGLQVLVLPPAEATGWHGPYVGSLPVDEWGHGYSYRLRTVRDASGKISSLPEVRSLGADDLPGGAGNDADISSLAQWDR